MSRLKEMESSFLNSSLAFGHLDHLAQLGLPWLYLKKNRLCLRYLPHREELRDGRLFIYSPAHRLDLLCPHVQVLHFSCRTPLQRHLSYEPLYIFDADWQLEQRAAALTALYTRCDQVLDRMALLCSNSHEPEWDLSRIWTDHDEHEQFLQLLEEYQCFYRETVSSLGLDALYGGVNHDTP